MLSLGCVWLCPCTWNLSPNLSTQSRIPIRVEEVLKAHRGGARGGHHHSQVLWHALWCESQVRLETGCPFLFGIVCVSGIFVCHALVLQEISSFDAAWRPISWPFYCQSISSSAGLQMQRNFWQIYLDVFSWKRCAFFLSLDCRSWHSTCAHFANFSLVLISILYYRSASNSAKLKVH